MTSFRKIDLRKVHVVIVLETMQIEGMIYVDPGAPRFSDAWDSLIRDRRQYISVREATLEAVGAKPRKVSFIAVDKLHVRAIFPLDEPDGD